MPTVHRRESPTVAPLTHYVTRDRFDDLKSYSRVLLQKYFSRSSPILTGHQPSVLIVAAKWWSTSARMAMALLRNGCRVGAVCPAGHPLRYISGIDHIRRYDGIRSLSSLRRSIKDWPADVILPCDDGVVAQLHELHRREPALRVLIERSIGSPESYGIVRSRFQLLKTAEHLGIRVPKTARVGGEQDLTTWHRDHHSISVLKVDGESGGNGVRFSRSLNESLAAWHELTALPSTAQACKRLVVDRDPLAMWMRTNPGERGVTIQQFVAGRPANSMLVSRDGVVLSQVGALVVASDGPTGAATIIRHLTDRRIAHAGELLAAKLRLNGFCGLDFMIEADTGTPYLIEMNPRCTQLGHLEFANLGSLAGAFSADLKSEADFHPVRPIGPGTIALFPQAFRKSVPPSPHLDSSYHDIPWAEPQLVQELMLDPCPSRSWAARVYHHFRPVPRRVQAEYENSESTVGSEVHCAVS
jgi:hypothetical protein